MKTHRLLLPALLSALSLLLASQSLHAGSATWNLNPTTGDWNTAANWTPNTVPNGPSDVATFATSYDPNVSINASVELESVVFDSSAPNFTITIGTAILSITGAGIISNTAAYQYFIGGEQRGIFFYNSATVANSTFFVANGGTFSFNDSSSAGHGNFLINTVAPYQADLEFLDNSTAAEATITVSLGFVSFSGGTGGNAVITAVNGGSVVFDSSADHAVVTCSSAPGIVGSGISFGSTGTGAQGSFTAEGAARSGDSPAYITLGGVASGGDGGFVVDGGGVQGASGAVMTFFESSTAGNATLTANGGLNGGDGGAILFVDGARGGTASISLFGNGELDIGNSRATAGVAIGSLAGDGLVFLGPKTLTIGSNNQSTTFSGVIQDGGDNQGTGGSLTKMGTGTLTFNGASTYTGATAVTAGVLKVGNKTGSATGTGAVNINAGTLGGGGIISGAVTVGTGGDAGAFLAPATGTNKQAALTIQTALTFNSGSTYSYTFKAKGNKARTDKVIANGVTINGATFAFQGTAQGALKQGLVLTAISNTAATPITGTFANLPDGAILTVNGNNFQASYEGGDGNDLILTVVP